MHKIDLTKLQLRFEPNHDDDKITIFTTIGMHKQTPLSWKCQVAELYCGDTTDEDDTAYQIAKLFIAAPEMLDMLKSCAEDLAFSAENCDKELHSKLLAVIAKAEGQNA